MIKSRKPGMRQVLVYCCTEAEVHDPSLMRRGLADVASRGFDGVSLEFRNVRSGLLTPRLRRAIARFCRLARACGLAVVGDVKFTAGEEMKVEAPELFLDALLPHRLPLRDGRFTLSFPDEVLHTAIAGCWVIEGEEGTPRRLRALREVTGRVRIESSVTDGGGCAMTEVKGPAKARLTYRVPGASRGEVLVVLRRRFDYAFPDLSQPKLRRYTQRRLDMFRGLGVRGYSWDEPHFGFAIFEGGRAISDNLLRLFRRRFGYDLRDRLPDLWWDLPDGRSAMTRLHYAELLESCLAGMEKDLVRRAPKAEFLGIHRTMHEETSDDFHIGCCDYFRHNRYTRGGFTDSVFEREDSMITMMQLARSLAAANGTEAWNNSWGFIPEERHHADYLRLMGAMQIGWLGHAYHSTLFFGPGYPNHPLWRTLPGHLASQRALLKALAGANAVADTAVVYNWRALATFPDKYLHVHRRDLLLLGKALTDAQVQFRFLDADALPGAAAGSWRRIVVPWPDLLPAGALARLTALARAGVQVLIFGPPASLDAEGRRVAEVFAQACGIRTLDGSATLVAKEGSFVTAAGRRWRLDPTALEPNYRSNEKESYPEAFKAYALQPLAGTEAIATLGSRVVGVRRGNLSYLAVEMPHYAGLATALCADAAATEAPTGWRVFEYERGGARLLAGVVRHGASGSGTVVWRGHRVSLKNCRSFVLAEQRGTVRVAYHEAGDRRR